MTNYTDPENTRPDISDLIQDVLDTANKPGKAKQSRGAAPFFSNDTQGGGFIHSDKASDIGFAICRRRR